MFNQKKKRIEMLENIVFSYQNGVRSYIDGSDNNDQWLWYLLACDATYPMDEEFRFEIIRDTRNIIREGIKAESKEKIYFN